MPSSSIQAITKSLFRRATGSKSDSTNMSDQQNTAENQCLFEGFEWNVPADQKHWRRLEASLESLKAIGIDNIWLPPGCKATHPSSNGYDMYDLYDLGEFDQKGSRSTKWGSKEELISLSSKAQEVGIGLTWDAVLNHRAGGDFTERCKAVEVDDDDRTIALCKPKDIEAWLGFDFPGRGDQYSSFKYRAEHFSGTDYDASTHKKAIYLLTHAKTWSPHTDTSERGNYDYLMFSNNNLSHPAVLSSLVHWGTWLPTQLSLSGIRIDAARHISTHFLQQFLSTIQTSHPDRNWLFIGEYWQDNTPLLRAYLKRMKHALKLFDAPLVYNLHRLGQAGEKGDLRTVFKGSLVEKEPEYAVTLVTNHDTQVGQTLNVPVAAWLQGLAYAMILLREGGTPCVFYGDLYGTRGEQGAGPTCCGKLADLVLVRKLYAYGRQWDYFDDRNCVGWTREGVGEGSRRCGIAVVGSNKAGGRKRMFVGKRHKGERWNDVWEWGRYETVIDEDGYGVFEAGGVGVNAYLEEHAAGRDRFGQFDYKIYGKC